MRVGAPSGEDETGLLQGHQSQTRLPGSFSSTSLAIRSGRGWRNGKGELFGVSFLPAASPKALKAIRQAIRGWSLQTRSDKALDDLARMFNPYIRGWINYYSHFYKSALYPTLRRIDAFSAPMGTMQVQAPEAKAEGCSELAGTCGPFIAGSLCSLAASIWPRPNTGSRMSREVHVRFWERAGVKFPPRDSLAAVSQMLRATFPIRCCAPDYDAETTPLP